MAFSDLSSMTQSLMVANFEFKAKVIMLGMVVIFSIFFLSYMNKKDKSPYITSSIMKSIAKASAYMFIIMSPLFSWFLSPAVDFGQVIIFVVSIYFVGMSCFGLWLIIAIFYYSPLYVLRFIGIDMEGEKDNKALNKIDKMLFGNLAKASNFRRMVKNGKS